MIATTIRNTDTTNNAGFPPAPPEAHQRAVVAQMRGLAIRADYALSRAIAEADPADEDAQLSLEIAVLQAEFLGYADWKNEQTALPIMFADEPELLRAWAEGQYRAAMAALEVRQGL